MYSKIGGGRTKLCPLIVIKWFKKSFIPRHLFFFKERKTFKEKGIIEKAESKTVSWRQLNWLKNNDEYPQRDSYPAWIRHRHTQKEKTFISPHTAYHCNYTVPKKSVFTGSAFRIHLQCGCWMDTARTPTVRYNRIIVSFLCNFLLSSLYPLRL